MKISHLTFSTSGGAGVAAQELHTSLIDASVDSTINFLIKDNLRKNKFRFKIFFFLRKPDLEKVIMNKRI